MGTVGIIANPLAGKDLRRLVTHASPTSDAAKIGIVRRAVIGAVEGGATRVLMSPDNRNLCERALEGLTFDADVTVVDEPFFSTRGDTSAIAARLRDEGAGALVVLGGDGTNRDVAKGWIDAPVVPISTGTNNVFPVQIEATIAGHAAGLVACGAVPLAIAADRAKVLHVSFDDATPDDLALVELALIDGGFTGARAVWEGATVKAVVAAIAEPACVGLSSLAASAHALSRRDDGAVAIITGADGAKHRVPLAPGTYATVGITSATLVDSFVLTGPGVLAFDGERDRVLGPGSTATIHVRRDGPWVIDVRRTMCRGVHTHGH